jgi:hypothetical protein
LLPSLQAIGCDPIIYIRYPSLRSMNEKIRLILFKALSIIRTNYFLENEYFKNIQLHCFSNPGPTRQANSLIILTLL